MPSNIVGGSARTDKSFSHFLEFSLGSSFELGTQLLVARHRKYINQEILEKLEEKIEEVQKMTRAFKMAYEVYFLSSLLSILNHNFKIKNNIR